MKNKPHKFIEQKGEILRNYRDDYLEHLRYQSDPQEQPVSLHCDKCGAEIYEGEEYYTTPELGDVCEKCFDYEADSHKKDCERIAGDDKE